MVPEKGRLGRHLARNERLLNDGEWTDFREREREWNIECVDIDQSGQIQSRLYGARI